MGLWYVGNKNYKSVFSGNLPVLVEVGADWCPPCISMRSVLSEIADDYQGKVRVAILNVDKNDKAAEEIVGREIQSIPMFVFVAGGVRKKVVNGAMTGAKIRKQLDKILK
jgi:thioredoxin 1